MNGWDRIPSRHWRGLIYKKNMNLKTWWFYQVAIFIPTFLHSLSPIWGPENNLFCLASIFQICYIWLLEIKKFQNSKKCWSTIWNLKLFKFRRNFNRRACLCLEKIWKIGPSGVRALPLGVAAEWSVHFFGIVCLLFFSFLPHTFVPEGVVLGLWNFARRFKSQKK